MKLKSSISVRPSFRACVLNDVQFEQGLTLVFIFFFVFSGLYIPVWTERLLRCLNTAVRPVLVGFIPLIYTCNGLPAAVVPAGVAYKRQNDVLIAYLRESNFSCVRVPNVRKRDLLVSHNYGNGYMYIHVCVSNECAI